MNIPRPFSDKTLSSLFAGLCGNDSFAFFESIRVTPENHLSYLFLDPVTRLVCNLTDDPANFFSRAEEKLAQGYFLAGYLSYEFGYLLEPILAKSFKPRPAGRNTESFLPLADLGVFRTPHIYDHRENSFSGAGPWPTGNMPESGPAYSIDNLRLNLHREEYLKAIQRIKSYIGAGDTYQVNYTLKLLFDFSGSVFDFYNSLRRNQSVSYGGLIRSGDWAILTLSPELFFRKHGSRINVRPMKGTMQRGRTIAEDRAFADSLHHDIKNRSENVMIVDLLRNDLGRLSRMGGVTVQSLFNVETYETLHQMTSNIEGKVELPVSLADMFRALYPCGSVTGAPKIRTMEIIRELEAADRGVYTGAIGFLAPDGDAVFNVPIRTVVIRGNEGEMGIGSGIVWDSNPKDEWEECILKGRFLTTPAPDFKLIETMLWHPVSGYWLLDLHLERLAESAHYFFFPLALENIRAGLEQAARRFSSGSPQSCRRVRLTLTKEGESAITHSGLQVTSLPEADPVKIMQRQAGKEDAKVVFSPRNTDSTSPHLYHKTTLRQIYDDERSRLVDKKGYYEVLFVNEKGEVTEGSYTNIFLQKDAKLMTPPVSCGLLPGVLRKYLLQQYPDTVVEKTFTGKDVKEADALYVGNSVRGLVRVQVADEE
ncbi:MAG: aminodeoxychorismate synthase component I [Desulfobulbales bacterium]|nr:aminodeoxychorismate synthase component I [Desulfobulbales bacterium]